MVQQTYTELTNDHKQIIITWIPSHQGIEGNEKADSLVKEATTDRTNESNIPIQHQDLLASTTKAEREEWNRIWTTTNINNRNKIHDIAHHFYQKIPNNNISRKERIAMTRLRVGHEHLLSKTEPPFLQHLQPTNHHPISATRMQKIPKSKK